MDSVFIEPDVHEVRFHLNSLYAAGILSDVEYELMFERIKRMRPLAGLSSGDFSAETDADIFTDVFPRKRVERADTVRIKVATHAALRFAFDRMGLVRVEASILPKNAASIRGCDFLGFARDGHEMVRVGKRERKHFIFAVTPETLRYGRDETRADEREDSVSWETNQGRHAQAA